METQDIEVKVKAILADKLNVAADKIDMHANLKDDLNMDSFGSIEVAFELEDTFQIKIPDADIVKVVTVKDVVDYIKERVQQKTS